eukprot:TRINITY_DN3637_c0_g1_i1.p2 TRINITY_DN3637_c0_g1~~TRINITY_DN3637_c0_g1_i1.p2  ORF type:complete len:59 (+),score=12.32 TRINITY_DN3637_c0_g1_i1:261-437(+)
MSPTYISDTFYAPMSASVMISSFFATVTAVIGLGRVLLPHMEQALESCLATPVVQQAH